MFFEIVVDLMTELSGIALWMTAFTSFSFGICNDPFSFIRTPLVRYDCLEYLDLNLGEEIFGPFLLPVTDLKKFSYATDRSSADICRAIESTSLNHPFVSLSFVMSLLMS